MNTRSSVLKIASKIVSLFLIISFGGAQVVFADTTQQQSELQQADDASGATGQSPATSNGTNSVSGTSGSTNTDQGLDNTGQPRGSDTTATTTNNNTGVAQAAGGAASCAITGLLSGLFSSMAGSVTETQLTVRKKTANTGAAAASSAGGGQITVSDPGAHNALAFGNAQLVAANTYLDEANSYLQVSTDDLTKIKHNTAHITAKETGGAEGLGAGTGFSNSASLDSIGFCIINQIIQYIGQSTIQWINSGFKGKPVFVDNPQRYFQNIADQEAGYLVQQIAGNATGINVCQPFRTQLAIDTIGSYNSSLESNRRSALNCSLSQIAGNYDQFAGGDWSAGGRAGWFEIIQPQNNIYGAQQLANREAFLSASQRQNTATLNLNLANGYRDFTVCDKKRPDGSCETGFERKTTLGGYVENAVNARANSPEHRIEIATAFDQIVTSLVNQLVKIAVNKLFDNGSQQGQ